MPTEMRMLLFSSILGLCQILLQAATSTGQRGLKWNASARDGEAKPLTGYAARLDRALNNFKETFPLFIAAVLMASSLQTYDSLTAIGSQIYFWGRVVYLPLYAFAIPYVRSLVWSISVFGILLIFFSVATN